MLEFTDKYFEFKRAGEVYKLKLPTVSQVSDFIKMLSDQKDKTEEEIIISYLESLGLSKDVTQHLQMEHLNKIVEHIGYGKK